MFHGFGFFVVLACVAGGFMLSGGNVAIVGRALPHELMVILGGGLGTFIIANSKAGVAAAIKGIGHVFRGEHWNKQDYRDLLALLFMIVRTLRTKSPLALETHIEAAADSTLFNRFPKLAGDTQLIAFICDYLRMMTLDLTDPHQLNEVAENDIERMHAEEMQPQHALLTLADALPAIGIVAAVLGVIKTMGSIDQPTNVLGAMIGGALVGTFLGVLLSYTVVGPLASRLGQILDEENKLYHVVRTVLVASLQGMSPTTAVEIGRRSVPSRYAPTFAELESITESLPRDIA